MKKLSHVDAEGKARMVDVGGKEVTARSATASVMVRLNETAFAAVRDNQIGKGDVLTVAKLAGIQAAKRTSELIPLCHQVPLNKVDMQFTLNENDNTILITATATADWTTGVEMEALTACSVAALTVYDMVKAVQKDAIIDDLKLLAKKGGKSGAFTRADT